MKKVIFIVVVIVPLLCFSQTIENLDYISPFNNDIAAIKKNDQWAFINTKGEVIIDFRNDVVVSQLTDGNYPIFNDRRCLITHKKEGISYFGYIDTSGNVVIEPQFLNASNFIDGFAISLKLEKEEVTVNTALAKNVVYYRYYHVIIDPKGDIINYLTKEGKNVVLDKDYLRVPPKIMSQRLSDNLYALMDENRKWRIIKFN